MLCPNVWNLNPPKVNISYKNGQLNSKTEKCIQNIVSEHSFNQIVSIILPNESSIPLEIRNLILDTDYYIVHNFNLSDLIHRQLIEGFIKRGKLTALSTDVSSEIDDCFGVTSNGKLILSINKDLYQRLGLEGDPLSSLKKENNKYIIQIDLKHPDLIAGTKYYNRIKVALSNEELKNKSIQFQWNSSDDICPSSIAKYLNDIGYKVDLCQTKIKQHIDHSLKVPKLISNHITDEEFVHQFVESLGMSLLSCNIENENLNSYSCSEPFDTINANIVHFKGLLSIDFITKLIGELRKYVMCKNDLWVGLNVHGYPNAPIICPNKHKIPKFGNNYTIVFYPNNDFLFYVNKF